MPRRSVFTKRYDKHYKALALSVVLAFAGGVVIGVIWEKGAFLGGEEITVSPIASLPPIVVGSSAAPMAAAQSLQSAWTGNLVLQNGLWNLVYEKPGSPALSKDLFFSSQSGCVLSGEFVKCATGEQFASGSRVTIEGKDKGKIISVSSLRKAP